MLVGQGRVRSSLHRLSHGDRNPRSVHGSTVHGGVLHLVGSGLDPVYGDSPVGHDSMLHVPCAGIVGRVVDARGHRHGAVPVLHHPAAHHG